MSAPDPSKTIIEPTPGRVVWYWPSPSDLLDPTFTVTNHHDPLAAVVARVHGTREVNLAVFDQAGATHSRQNVVLLQASDDPVPASLGFAEWMPYQRGQAAKADAKAQATKEAA